MGEINLGAAIWRMLGQRWRKTIKAKALSANTERSYLSTVERWARWLTEQQLDLEPHEVRARHIDDFIADLIESTSAANGAHHYRNLRVFFGWLVKRREIERSPMVDTEPPQVPEKITPLLSDTEHRAVLAACSGKSFLDVRDTAIVLLFLDTGLRVSELGGLRADAIDLQQRRFLVCGKGNKIRWVGFGNSTGLALARYLRARARQPGSRATTALWLSRHGEPLRLDGIKRMLHRRGKQAGVTGTLHAHRFRHDFSHRWQAAGGSEHGLMMLAGWSSTKMPRHYGKQAAMLRALEEQARLSPADNIA